MQCNYANTDVPDRQSMLLSWPYACILVDSQLASLTHSLCMLTFEELSSLFVGERLWDAVLGGV